METLITSVTLVKANDHRSEQTFSVGVTVAACSVNIVNIAQIKNEDNQSSYDYRLNTTNGGPSNFVSMVFPPSQQTLTFPFYLNADSSLEVEECFKAVVMAVNLDTYPAFQASAFQSTNILIEDNDGTCLSQF